MIDLWGAYLILVAPNAQDTLFQIEPELKEIGKHRVKCHTPLDDTGRPTYG